jgi:hypothetical protein
MQRSPWPWAVAIGAALKHTAAVIAELLIKQRQLSGGLPLPDGGR